MSAALQFTLLPAKLKQAGFAGHMIGKGHLGYQTTDHLPIRRGFASHRGYLQAWEQYQHGLQPSCDVPQDADLPGDNGGNGTGQWPPPGGAPRAANCHKDFWVDAGPADQALLDSLFYSTNIYAERAIELIKANRDPLYIHLTWQAVHGPYTPAPAWESLQPSSPYYSNYCPPPGVAQTQVQHERCDFGSMLKVVECVLKPPSSSGRSADGVLLLAVGSDGMANVTAALRATGRWDDALLVVSSDNGGIGPGNNFP